MKHHRFGTLGVMIAALLLAAAPASAAPVTVNLRIEGSSSTVFEGPVTTDAKTIDGHPCDGTNGGANPTPGPTMTSALDDASVLHGFSWSGSWFDSLHDFSIDSIGPDSANASQFWGYAYNGKPSNVGGCQQEVHNGDDVLFAFDFFSKAHLLQLSGPTSAATGQPVALKVVDSQDGSAVSGVTVGGATTGPDGTASVTFSSPGVVRLKADRSDSVRSNELDVCVYVPNSGDCGSQIQQVQGTVKDKVPPSIAIGGIRDGARFRRGHGPRKLAGSASDASGLFQVYFRLERRSGGRCRWYSSKRSVFTRASRGCANARFQHVGTDPTWSYLLPARLGPGRYRLEEKAIDRVFNTARESVSFTVVN